MNKISIIIPILNEAEIIENLLNHILNNISTENISEIIIVDGGSTDGSLDVINSFVSGRAQSRPTKNFATALEETQIICIGSEKGRAVQMNFGAKNAKGNVLYFLHADSLPPEDFDQAIINEIKKGNEAGCFRLQFNSNHFWLKLAGWFTQFNWRACRGGDQSQFITKKLFNAIGGFNESYKVYEDNILVHALYKRNQFVVINKKLKTSARLYQKHGIWKLQFFYWCIYVKKWLGADAQNLHCFYNKYVNVKK